MAKARVGSWVIIMDPLHPYRGRRGYVISKKGLRFPYTLQLDDGTIVACVSVKKIS